jgi:hypothetical protein
LSDRHEVFVGQARWREFRAHYKPIRDCKTNIYLIFAHPRIEEVVNDIGDCLRGGAVAAAIGAIVAIISGVSGSISTVSLAAFKGVFYACMYQRGISWAMEIEINVESRAEGNKCGDWR